MNYEYTKVNRIKEPHNYMYSPFQGNKFLDAYFHDRLKHLKIFQHSESLKYIDKTKYLVISPKATDVLMGFIDTELSDNFFETLKTHVNLKDIGKLENYLANTKKTSVENLSTFKLRNNINTEELLLALLNTQLDKGDENLIIFWLDLLIQRFEVSKKIYENYSINFRKTDGKNSIYHLYWLLSLSLSLVYLSTRGKKYLSTLLKVIDLLCSIDEKLLVQTIPPQNLTTSLIFELLSIKSLLNNIDEVNFDFA